jgi:hypothetical protein
VQLYLSHPYIFKTTEPNKRYAIAILMESSAAPAGDAWDVLEALAGSVEAPLYWSSEHDHYLYGTPK